MYVCLCVSSGQQCTYIWRKGSYYTTHSATLQTDATKEGFCEVATFFMFCVCANCLLLRFEVRRLVVPLDRKFTTLTSSCLIFLSIMEVVFHISCCHGLPFAAACVCWEIMSVGSMGGLISLSLQCTKNACMNYVGTLSII